MVTKEQIIDDGAKHIEALEKALEQVVLEAETRYENYAIALKMLSEPVFHPTGSRRFGYERPNSDYDFFIKESDMKAYSDHVLELGFKVVSRTVNMSYSDVSVVFIFQLDDFIHIQVIKDSWFDAKLKAQDEFERILVKNSDGSYRRPVGSKRTLARLWNELLRSCRIPWSDSPIE